MTLYGRVLVAVDAEDVTSVPRRRSSVVSIPMSRRSTADPVAVVTHPLRTVGINVTLHTAAAVAAAVAATADDSPSSRSQPSGSVDARRWSHSTADCVSRLGNRQDQQLNSINGIGRCSVVGCTDAVSSASTLLTCTVYSTHLDCRSFE